MYEISEKQGYVRINFSGRIGLEEMKEWLNEMRSAMSQPDPSGLIMIDLREMSVLPKEALAILETAQRAGNKSGLKRSAVIVKSAIIQMQFERIAKLTGIYTKERYISAETNPRWEKAAEAWILHGTEPA